jgi:DeoR family transcriptional regulator, suf operon transcriptional repressor
MSQEMLSRQDQLLELLLNSKKGLSIEEIATRLEISRNAVKQHLTGLENSQLVKKDTLNNTGGRPSRNYVLTEKGINHFPKQYAWFCSLILAELKDEMSDDLFRAFMRKIAEKLAKTLKPQFIGKSLAERAELLVEIMQSLGYHADLSSGFVNAEPAIEAFNCVYHDLAQQHPELCEFDRTLMMTLLEQPVEQTGCMANNDCSCLFKIKLKPD